MEHHNPLVQRVRRSLLAIVVWLIPMLWASAQVSQTFTTSGSFTPPAGVTQVVVECWGAGGRGGTRSTNGQGGGGGGGAYSRALVPVTPLTPYTVTVGIGSTSAAPGGDSWFGTSGTVMAKGGNSCANNSSTGVTGGTAAASIGTVKFDGGAGSNGGSIWIVRWGGGGGSSAGYAAVGGNAPSGNTGGTAPAGGGNGGDGASSQANGSPGFPPGGGGGGAVRTSSGTRTGGAGADGQVIVTYYNNGDCISGTNGFNTIPDNGCSGSVFTHAPMAISGLPTTLGTAPGNARLASVELIVEHTYNSDLRITLTSPAGNTRNLVLNRFGNGDNLGNPGACPGTVLTLTDGAAALVNTNMSNVSGTYAPEQTLDGFTGDPNGTWVINVCDNAGLDVGRFVMAKLNFCTVPLITSFSSNSPICEGSTLTLNSTATGDAPLAFSWSGTGTFSPNNTSANVTVTGAATGNYTLTVSNACGAAVQVIPVTVNPLPIMSCPPDISGVCSADAPFALSGATPAGGTYSGTGVSGGNFDPAVAGGGTHTITYSYTDGNGCTNTCTFNIDVTTATTWYSDLLDGDGLGDPGSPLMACAQPPGYVADNTDLCPAVSGTVGSACDDGDACTINDVLDGACNCAGTFQDSDGDTVCDANDNCPMVPGQVGSPCDDGDDCTINDVLDGTCNCAGTPSPDTDGDGACDADDGCPNDPNKTWEGVCGCGNPDVDGDGDTVMDCLDGCPTDPNKFEPGVCGCGVPDTDTDGDSVLDCNDLCPLDPLKTAPGSCGCGHAEPGTACDDGDPNTGNDTVNANCQCLGQPLDCAGTPGGPALPGTPCDDLDPGTANDVYDANCTCAGTPTSQSVALVLDTDDDGDQTSWEIIPQGGGTPLCSGANYPNNSTITLSCPLADGCYELRVMDSFGDGMTIGGYLLRDAQNQRIIDNTGNGDFGTLSQIANNGGFCLPLGTDHVRPSRCDLENLLPTDWTAAQENPAVSAQFGQGDQSDDGYQFWFFDPNGTYSRRILVTHANSDPTFPYGPARCSHLRFTSMVTSPLPHNTLLNVRVRARVNGSYAPFGPACRLRIDPVAQCPTTQLVDDTNSPLHSCGITNVLLDGSQYLHAQYVGNAVTYQWEFDDINSAYLRRIAAGSSALHLSAWATLPLQYNTSYSVRVRVSYDGGTNWCPWGAACTITTAPLPPGQGQGRGLQALPADEPATFQLWPNPNRGDRVNVLADGLPLEAGSAELALVDLAGRTVIAQQVPVTDGTVQYVLDLQGRAVPGLYTLVLRTQDSERALRLVVQ